MEGKSVVFVLPLRRDVAKGLKETELRETLLRQSEETLCNSVVKMKTVCSKIKSIGIPFSCFKPEFIGFATKKALICERTPILLNDKRFVFEPTQHLQKFHKFL